jgi:NAD(P)-dependent dehydrogenase (short-subunit alcohol dehydrogenase family)
MMNPARGTALVTGCSSGFGLRTAVSLALTGFRVVATMRDLSRRNELDVAADSAGIVLDIRQMDVTDSAAASDLIAGTGAIDVLVNNAGTVLAGIAEDISADELRGQLESNFLGAVNLANLVIPGMRERRAGRIINISSILGRFGSPGLAAYSASKWALEGWSESLRYDLLPYGVFVCLVEPGLFPTNIAGRNRHTVKHADDTTGPYAEAYRRMARRAKIQMERSRSDSRHVADAVCRLALMSRPPLRTPVGIDAKLALRVLPLVPQSLLECLRLYLLRRRRAGG